MKFDVRMTRCIAAAASLALGACATSHPGLPPPGFGGTALTFDFPIAVAVDSTGQNVYVANGNFDQNYTSGTLMQVAASAFNDGSGGAIVPMKSAYIKSNALLDNFAGQMLIDCPPLSNRSACSNAEKRLYVTTRGSSTVSSALLDGTSGNLICPSNNCSSDAIHLAGGPNYLDGPFALALGTFPIPGSATPTGNLVVTNMSPTPTSTNGTGHDGMLGVIPEPAQATPPAAPVANKAFSSVAYRIDLTQPGATTPAPASDAVAVSPGGVIYVGGCFILVTGEAVEPCLADSTIVQFQQNPIRYLFADANGSAEVQSTDFGANFAGGQVVAMAMSSTGNKLYVATSTPNALVTIDLPHSGGSSIPVTESVVPLANGPNQILVLPRNGAGQGDLVAVTASDPNVILANSNAFILVDPTAGTVVAQLQPLGRTPYGMAAWPTVATGGAITSYRVYVAIFTDCAIAAVDIPTARPDQAAHVSTVGTCPKDI